MRYTYTILFGILFGVAMNVLWGLVCELQCYRVAGYTTGDALLLFHDVSPNRKRATRRPLATNVL